MFVWNEWNLHVQVYGMPRFNAPGSYSESICANIYIHIISLKVVFYDSLSLKLFYFSFNLLHLVIYISRRHGNSWNGGIIRRKRINYFFTVLIFVRFFNIWLTFRLQIFIFNITFLVVTVCFLVWHLIIWIILILTHLIWIIYFRHNLVWIWFSQVFIWLMFIAILRLFNRLLCIWVSFFIWQSLIWIILLILWLFFL